MSSPNLAVNKDNNTANNGNNQRLLHTPHRQYDWCYYARALRQVSPTAPAGSDKASSTSPPLPLPTKVTSLQNAIGTFKRGSNRVRSIFGRSKSSAAADDDDDPPSNRDDGAHSSGPPPHAAGVGHLHAIRPAAPSSPAGTLNSKRQSGTFSNLTDSADGDMMFRAAQAGDYEAVHFLLEECVDDAARKKLVGSVNSRQQTALVLAATNGFDEICRMLIEVDHTLMSRADRTGWSALHYAASEKRISTAMLLVRKGHDPNIRNDEGSTPLHYAIRIGPRHQTEDLLDLLEDHGADLDAQTRHGETALHQAAFRGNFANAGWLLAHGATPNLVDKHGHTALHKAAMLGHKHAATVLLDHGVDRNIKANNGQTARDVAVEFKQTEIVEYLDEYERSVADAAHRRARCRRRRRSTPIRTPPATAPRPTRTLRARRRRHRRRRSRRAADARHAAEHAVGARSAVNAGVGGRRLAGGRDRQRGVVDGRRATTPSSRPTPSRPT
jgi:ankyrin repeat protein